MKISLRKICAILSCVCLITTSCSQRFSHMSSGHEECGYLSNKFNEFSECISGYLAKKVSDDYTASSTQRNQVATNDPVTDLTSEFISKIQAMNEQYSKHLKSKPKNVKKLNQEYYNRYNQLLSEYVQKEQKINDRAAAIATVLLVGAAAIAVAKNGGGGGGGGQSSNNCSMQGCCSYHKGVKAAQYDGTVMCNDGQLSPHCHLPVYCMTP